MKPAFSIIALLLFFPALNYLRAQPSLATGIIIDGQMVYRDSKQANSWYYMPPDYQLMSGGDGKPSITLIQMRYTGTAATGDEGLRKTNNIFQFRIGVDSLHHRKLLSLQAAMKKGYPGSQLRMLPVRKFSSILIFSGTNHAEGSDSLSQAKTNGYAEPTDENAEINNSYWNERVVTFRINNEDAQMIAAALKDNKTALSFGYAFYTAFSDSANNVITTNAGEDIKAQLSELFREVNKSDSSLVMVKADAVPLKADVTKWPSVIVKTDINESVPAKFPVFTVYCYDFNNAFRDDLFAKKIEIKARSVNGSDVEAAFTFKQAKPEQFAKNIKFQYAVRFDRPFYYRVTEINNDGEPQSTEWMKRDNWTEMIDITSPPEKFVRKAIVSEE